MFPYAENRIYQICLVYIFYTKCNPMSDSVATAAPPPGSDRFPVVVATFGTMMEEVEAMEGDRTANTFLGSNDAALGGSVSVLLRFCLPAVFRLNWPAVVVCSLRLAPRLRCCWRRGDSPSY